MTALTPRNITRDYSMGVGGGGWGKGGKRGRGEWGLPFIDGRPPPQKIPPRILNVGWLLEDAETDELEKLHQALNRETDPIIIKQLNQDIGNLKVNYRQDIQ